MRYGSMGLSSEGQAVGRAPSRHHRGRIRARFNKWGQILLRAGHEALQDDIPTAAASITFFALLAFFPAVGAFVSLYGLIADIHVASQHLSYLAGILPSDVLQFVGDEMVRAAVTHKATLSVAFVFSLALSLWSANAGVQALIVGLNVAYERRETRGILTYYLLSLAITGTALIGFVAVFTAIVVIPVVEEPTGVTTTAIPALVRWTSLWAISAAVLAALYRFAPDRKRITQCSVWPGSLIATSAWLLMSLGYSWYVGSYAHYDRTYGSLGAVVGFMMWIWLGAIVILFGAEVNAEVEQRCP